MAETSQLPNAPQPSEEVFVNAAAGIPADDDDSAYEETQSDTTSIASSVFAYKYENGRRYHAYGKEKNYIMPNDETEQDRLDLVHHIFLLVLGGELFAAPIKQLETILDLGTGTGIWAMDIADKFPSAAVIGNDLSPIQPSFVPPNLQFVIDDFEQDWPEERFDFIHARQLAGAVRDWQRLIKQAYDHLKPGGYFEAKDFAVSAWSSDNTLKEDSEYMKYLNNLHAAGDKTGKKMNIAPELKGLIKKAGFEDVTEKVYLIPLGPWPKDQKLKELGKWVSVSTQDAVEAYGLRLYTQVLGWSPDPARIHFALVKAQLRRPSVHAYTKLYVVYGRKPSPKSA